MASDFENPLPNVPWVESPFFEQILSSADLSCQEKERARHFHEHGYLVIDFEDDEFERHRADIIENLAGTYSGPHSKSPAAWRTNESVRALATNRAVLDLLRMLYGREPIPFQTLNFNRGSEQHIHSDAIHFHSVPERFMCAVWVSLEEITESNGPLIYYPGSHRLPIYDYLSLGLTGSGQKQTYEYYEAYDKLYSQLVEAHGLKPEELHMPAGKALVWAANLVHGGARQTDKNRTRYSQVTHYYFDRCAYYTPLLSDPFLGKVARRHVVDIRTDEVVPHYYNNQPLKRNSSQLFHALQDSARALVGKKP